jgi:hypothetical protein
MGLKSSKYTNDGVNVNGDNNNEAKYNNVEITKSPEFNKKNYSPRKSQSEKGSPRQTIFSTINKYYRSFNNSNTSLSINENVNGIDNVALSKDEIRIIQITWTFIKHDLQKVGIMVFMR